MLEGSKKVLVIAAHPDDEVLGVGATIPMLVKNGAEVHVLIFTDGSSVQYKDDENILEHKFDEATLASKIMGATVLPRLDFPDMKLDTVPHVEKNQALDKIISEGAYDTVFVQNGSDINKDHFELFKSTAVACRPHPHQKVKKLLSYYVNSSTEWGNILNSETFKPNVFVDVTNSIQVKLKAMEQYKTELRDYPHPRSIKALETSAAYFGNMVGYQYAEPFQLIFSR